MLSFSDEIGSVTGITSVDGHSAFIGVGVNAVAEVSYSCVTGYEVSGELIAKNQFECVRCLDKIPCDHVLPISITLINDKYIKSITEKNDRITFSEKQEHIQLGDFFIDIIALEKPMQPLCSIDCKGLCLICGSNRNHKFCSCTTPKQNNAWDELKKLNTK